MEQLKTPAQLVMLRKASRLTIPQAAGLYAVPVRVWRGFEHGREPVPVDAIALLEDLACVRPLPFDLDDYIN